MGQTDYEITHETGPGYRPVLDDDFDRTTIVGWLTGINNTREGHIGRFIIPTIMPGKVIVVTPTNADVIERHLRESFAHLDPDLLQSETSRIAYTQPEVEAKLEELMGDWENPDDIRTAATPQHWNDGFDL